MSDLKSFKISDQVKQPVERPRPGQKKVEEPAPSSAGFPRVEALVESEDPAELQGLAARQGVLEEMARGKGTPKEKAAAKKAAQGYAKARGLIDYLLETKRKMSGGAGGPPSGG